MRKTKIIIGCLSVVFLLSACWKKLQDFSIDNLVMSKTVTVVPPKPKGSVVVCRQGQCQSVRNRMTPEFVNNIVFNMFNNNAGFDVNICEADPSTRNCISEDIKFNMVSGVSGAVGAINSARVLEVRLRPQGKVVDIALDYNFFVNAIRPHCMPSRTGVIVKSNNYLMMESAGFNCQISGQEPSAVTLLQAVDHIDLDYGVIGATYSLGVSGPAYGGGTGYMVMRFRNNVHTINPHIPNEPGLYNPNNLSVPVLPPENAGASLPAGSAYPMPVQPLVPQNAQGLQFMPVPQMTPPASVGKQLPPGEIEVIPLPSSN